MASPRACSKPERSYDKRDPPCLRFPKDEVQATARPREHFFSAPVMDLENASTQLATTYDECTKDWCVVTVGKYAPKSVQSIPYLPKEPPKFLIDSQVLPSKDVDYSANSVGAGPEDGVEEDKHSQLRLLHHYAPTYTSPESTYRYEPAAEGLDLVGCRPGSFRWMEIECRALAFKLGEIEPLFCSLSLYRIDGKIGKKGAELNKAGSGRVAEVFHFDMCSQEIRKKYSKAFQSSPSSFGSKKTEESPISCCKRAMFPLDPAHATSKLYLVLQVSKVLQGDPEKVLEAYAKGKGKKADLDVSESVNRLWQFRQPVAFGVSPVLRDNGQMATGALGMVLFRQNSGMSEEMLMTNVIDAVAPDSKNKSLQVLDGRFSFVSKSLGRTRDNALFSCKGKRFDADYKGDIAIDSNLSEMHKLPLDTAPSRIVKEMQHIPLPSTLASSGIQSNFTNVVHVYLHQLDRSQHRNLAVKIELREYANEAFSLESSKVLPAIFGYQRGEALTTHYMTSVSYHCKSPLMTDVVKVKLPGNLSARHRLVFTVFHVHVKKKSGGIFSSSSPKHGDQVATQIATGFLGLQCDNALLCDDTYVVPLAETDGANGSSTPTSSQPNTPESSKPNSPTGASIPAGYSGMTLKVETRAISSVYAQDAQVASFLARQPAPLGSLPTSTSQYTGAASEAGQVSESDLEEVTSALVNAEACEVRSHFLVLARGLVRLMLGGSGARLRTWADPLAGQQLRRKAFIAFLHCLHKAAAAGLKDGERPDQEQLLAWVDFIFDEECPGRAGLGGGGQDRRMREEAEERLAEEAVQHAVDQLAQALAAEFVVESVQDHIQAEAWKARQSKDYRQQLQFVKGIASQGLKVAQDWGKQSVGLEIDNLPKEVCRRSSLLGVGDVLDELVLDDGVDEVEPDEYEIPTPTAGIKAPTGFASPSRGMAPQPTTNATTVRSRSPSPSPVITVHRPGRQSPINNSRYSGQGPGGKPMIGSLEAMYDRMAAAKTPPRAGAGQLPPFPAAAGSPRPPRSPSPQSPMSPKDHGMFGSEQKKNTFSSFEERWDCNAPRWYPWLYEVLISEWCSLLEEGKKGGEGSAGAGKSPLPPHTQDYLKQYSPVLFGLLFKSMALRVQYEGVLAPVKLESALSAKFERLVQQLGELLAQDNVPSWGNDCANSAMACFAQQSFAVLHVADASRLVDAYSCALREKGGTSNSAMMHNLEFLRAVTNYDHVASLNQPEPISTEAYNTKGRVGANAAAAAASANAGPGSLPGRPEPHWLANLVMQGCMAVFDKGKTALALQALSLLRGLLVFHAYDYRYQDPYYRQCVMAMYIPLLHMIPARVDRLDALPPKAPLRREMLLCFLHVISCVPHGLVQEMSRDLSAAFFKEFARRPSGEYRSLAGANPLAPLQDNPAHESKVLRCKLDEFQVLRVMGLLHLCVDSFEYPGPKNSEKLMDVLVPGVQGGVNSMEDLDKRLKTLSGACRGGKSLSGAFGLSALATPEDCSVSAKWVCHHAQDIAMRSALSLLRDALEGRATTEPAPKLLVKSALKLLLHGLSSRQSDTCIVRLLNHAMELLRQHGARVFLPAVGPALHDWVRVMLVHCNAQQYLPRITARNFLTFLLRSTFYYYGSIGSVRLRVLGVFQGLLSLISGELDKEPHQRQANGPCGMPAPKIKSIEDAVNSLAPLHCTLTEMRDDLPSTDAAFLLRMRTFMDELLLVKRAFLLKLRYIKKAANTDSTTGLGLDGYSSRYWQGIGATDMDTESVQELFFRAAMVFGAVELPNQRADWLFVLAEYHQMLRNDAEQGLCLVNVYQGFTRCIPIWDQLEKPPPVPTRKADADENLLRQQVVEGDEPIVLKPWNTLKDLKRDIMGHANQAGARLGQAALPILANSAYSETLEIARGERDYKAMAKAHLDIHNFMKRAADQQTQGINGIGAFFRVGFWGALPDELKGIEFVYRVPLMTHVSDFQKRVLQLIYPLVSTPDKVKVLPDSADESTLDDSPFANVKITSIKPRVDVFEAGEGAKIFNFSTPFTVGKKAHGSTAEQCKKLTELEVPLPFPCCCSRQKVLHRRITLLSPIECSMDDISTRITVMSEECRTGIDRNADSRSLMRLVQGSVLPQVNGGAVEVAECFLKRAEDGSFESTIPLITAAQAELLRQKLTDQLIVFLDLCRQLVIKARRVLNVPFSLPRSPASPAHAQHTAPEERTPEEVTADNNRVWQEEMERGLLKVRDAMEPFLSHGAGWEDLALSISSLTMF